LLKFNKLIRQERVEELEHINEEQSRTLSRLNVELARFKRDASENVDNLSFIS